MSDLTPHDAPNASGPYRRRPTLLGNVLQFVIIIAVLGALIWATLTPAVNGRPIPRQLRCLNNIQSVVAAMREYQVEHGCFPPAYIPDENGKPMHSWRVLLLPYLGHAALHREYRFDEPWNGPNNRKLHDVALQVYNCPSNYEEPSTNTSYVGVVGPNTLFPSADCTKPEDVGDGLEQTIAVVEMADSGIHWMEPRDLSIVQMRTTFDEQPGRGISSHHGDIVNVGFADASARSVAKSTDSETVEALLTTGGGEDVSPEEY